MKSISRIGDSDTVRLAAILIGITIGASVRNVGWWVSERLARPRPEPGRSTRRR